MINLLRDKYGEAIQAFPLVEGKIAVTSTDGTGSDGVFAKINLVCCTEDGGITITFNSSGTKEVTLVAGDIFTIIDASQIEIISGTFHLA